MHSAVYFFYFLAFLLVPVLILMAADALEHNHLKMTYIRLFVGALMGTVIGGALYQLHPFLALLAILAITFIWICVNTHADWREALMMTVFGWLVGGIFIWSIRAAFPTSFEKGPSVLPPASMQALNPTPHEERAALECLTIGKNETQKVLRTDDASDDIRLYRLMFTDARSLNGDGKSAYCEVYYLTAEGKMWLTVISDSTLNVQEIEGDAEVNRDLYTKRGNPEIIDSVRALEILRDDRDFNDLFMFYVSENPRLNERIIVTLSGVAYDEILGRYIWRAVLGERQRDEGKIVFDLDAVTGEILKKQRVERDEIAGKLIYWDKVGGGWVRK